ncbi:MAG TPA: TadE/TadG family type IV pilus assembly protein [Vicinamibacterales bacterium]|nr:TadE/TadG family type IV pilus assembly protein [Vicinamibacterales bacterium]
MLKNRSRNCSTKRKATWGGYHRNERGMTLVFVACGLLAFIAATMLAIDVGMLMTARNQAQNSADAGALAGAVGLGFNDYNDRTETGPAVTSAIAAATNPANNVMYGAVSVTPSDVVFENDPTGEPNRVKVTVYRNAERGNPLTTIIASIFGFTNTDVGATATAEVSPANAMTCVKPFTIPDLWIERTDPPFDSLTSTFELYQRPTQHGNPLPNPDVYIPADQPGYTGYNQEQHRGTRLMIRAGSGNNIEPSMYFSLALDGMDETGAEEYEWNIRNCNTRIVRWGEDLIQEPGAVMGPTIDGIRDLIARDPAAVWDSRCNCIRNSAYGSGHSPRLFPIPLYDPVVYTEGVRNGRYADLVVANWIGFFVEEFDSNNIWGRIQPIAGIRTGDPVPAGVFPVAIRLIK